MKVLVDTDREKNQLHSLEALYAFERSGWERELDREKDQLQSSEALYAFEIFYFPLFCLF